MCKWLISLLGTISTIIITVTSGVLVYVIGEILRDVWLGPLMRYKEIKQKISKDLVLYANLYSNPMLNKNIDKSSSEYKEYNNASKVIREDASELSGFIETLSFIKIRIPKKENLYKASAGLIGLSNVFFVNEDRRLCDKYREDIYINLDLKYDN